MENLNASSSSSYSRNYTPSISFTPDKKHEADPRRMKSIAFILHRCHLCNVEGTTKSCKKCKKEVCLIHSLGSSEAYCLECEPMVKAEISREDYTKLLILAHQELKFVFSGVEQRRRERDDLNQNFTKLEEEIKAKTALRSTQETDIKRALDQSIGGNAAQLGEVDSLREAYDRAQVTEVTYRRKIEENRQVISQLVNQLDVINQEREIMADQLVAANLISKETVNVQILHRNACPECQAALEVKFFVNHAADFRMFNMTKEKKKTLEKRDLCRCVTM